MRILSKLATLLKDKEMDGVDIDSQERLMAHQAILSKKPMMQNIFAEFHHLYNKLDFIFFGNTKGLRIELGAGVSPVRDTFPEVLSTDLLPSPFADRIIDAQNMDLNRDSVRAFYGTNCFHHFTNPSAFFYEIERVVVSGGGAILIEPYHGILSSIFYKHVFTTEGFDKTCKGWITAQGGPATGANQALSYIVFERDKELFHIRHPNLKIVYNSPLTNYVRYLASGGLNFRSIVPQNLEPLLSAIEFLLSPLSTFLSLHHVITIRKS